MGARTVIAGRDVGKVFRPPATFGTLLRGRLRGAPFAALQGVSFEVDPGEGLGLMGPNGAGKSTLLRLIAGLLVPSHGHLRVCGIDTREGWTAVVRKIGYVPAEEGAHDSSISVREHLAWYAALHGLVRAEGLRRADELLERVGLSAHARRRARELSTGMRRRLSLARALLGDPQVLLLDEPTRGVDPAGAIVFHQYLRSLLGEGRSIVVATHDREEARALCARVGVLDHGRLLSLEAPELAAARLREMTIG
jgi:ABC-2 type transport system ATP-binding protein